VRTWAADNGLPLRWWAAIWAVTWPAAVTGVSAPALPPGLHAVAWRDLDDELNLCASDALSPDRQRAAARKAIRASRGQGWRMLLPVPSAALPGAPGTGQVRHAGALRAHLAIWAAVSAVLAVGAAGAYLAFAPQHEHGPAPAARPSAPGRTHPGGPAAHDQVSRHRGSRAAARPPGPAPRASTSDVRPRQAPSRPARPSPGDRRTPGPSPAPASRRRRPRARHPRPAASAPWSWACGSACRNGRVRRRAAGAPEGQASIAGHGGRLGAR
jgi:hypothetical protein